MTRCPVVRVASGSVIDLSLHMPGGVATPQRFRAPRALPVRGGELAMVSRDSVVAVEPRADAMLRGLHEAGVELIVVEGMAAVMLAAPVLNAPSLASS